MPRLIRVPGLGVVRVPDGVLTRDISRAINTHLATRPKTGLLPAERPQSQSLVGLPGNRLDPNSVLGQMSDVGAGVLSIFGPPKTQYETRDAGENRPEGIPRYTTGRVAEGFSPAIAGIAYHGSPHTFDNFDISK